MNLESLTPESFVHRLRSLGQHRAAFVLDPHSKRLLASHEGLDDVAQAIRGDERDFHQHEAVFFEIGPKSGVLLGAFVHKTVRGQAAGGVRFWPYASLGAFVRDGLRLARGMGRKNALAGLWWGGGKGVIARPADDRYRDPAFRRTLYREYGAFITSLRGCYVTAEDAGTTAPDMAEIFRTTRFVTCVPPAVGGSGNPSFTTAKGVVCAMEGALHTLGKGTLEGRRVAMQGVGNVGAAMVQELIDRRVAHVFATDVSEAHIAEASERFAGKPVELRLVSPEDRSVFEQTADIFAPNALGGILNPDTIPLLRASIVCGAANNQLLDEHRDDKALASRGIVYVPDFLCNRMGIVNCANEQYGILPGDPAIERHFGRDWENALFVITGKVIERAKSEGITTSDAANAIADELSDQPHPVWGHRSRTLIDALVRERWHTLAPLAVPEG